MDLTKKTTILFPPPLFEHLKAVARRRGVSVGELVRDACVECCGAPTMDEREAAVADLSALSLPVGDPGSMKREGVPSPGEIDS